MALNDSEIEGVACYFTARKETCWYVVYSDRVIEGSPQNSTSAVPIMPWGAADVAIPKCGDFFTS
jgi:CreA protein